MGISVKFVCHICQASFLQRNQIVDHYQCYHQNELNRTSATNHKETPRELPGTLFQQQPSQDPLTMSALHNRKKVYACSFCPSRFITRALLMQHSHDDHMIEVDKPNPDIKREPTSFRSRTNVKVSSEDKQLAERAIEDLQARGASTDDLTCCLCDPEKIFTAS